MTERTRERWFAKFREGGRSLQDLPRSGESLNAAVDAHFGVTSRESVIKFGCCQRTINACNALIIIQIK